jgi:hypothetical protein
MLFRYIYTDSSNNVELFSQTLLAASDLYKVNITSGFLYFVPVVGYVRVLNPTDPHSIEVTDFEKGHKTFSKTRYSSF